MVDWDQWYVARSINLFPTPCQLWLGFYHTNRFYSITTFLLLPFIVLRVRHFWHYHTPLVALLLLFYCAHWWSPLRCLLIILLLFFVHDAVVRIMADHHNHSDWHHLCSLYIYHRMLHLVLALRTANLRSAASKLQRNVCFRERRLNLPVSATSIINAPSSTTSNLGRIFTWNFMDGDPKIQYASQYLLIITPPVTHQVSSRSLALSLSR